MAFEILKKGRCVDEVEKQSLSISKNNIVFSKDINKFLKDYKYIQLSVDKENGFIGFKRTNKQEFIYKIHTKLGCIRIPSELKGKLQPQIYPVFYPDDKELNLNLDSENPKDKDFMENAFLIKVPKESIKDVKL